MHLYFVVHYIVLCVSVPKIGVCFSVSLVQCDFNWISHWNSKYFSYSNNSVVHESSMEMATISHSTPNTNNSKTLSDMHKTTDAAHLRSNECTDVARCNLILLSLFAIWHQYLSICISAHLAAHLFPLSITSSISRRPHVNFRYTASVLLHKLFGINTKTFFFCNYIYADTVPSFIILLKRADCSINNNWWSMSFSKYMEKIVLPFFSTIFPLSNRTFELISHVTAFAQHCWIGLYRLLFRVIAKRSR